MQAATLLGFLAVLASCKTQTSNVSEVVSPEHGLSPKKMLEDDDPKLAATHSGTLPKLTHESEAWPTVQKMVSAAKGYTGRTLCSSIRQSAQSGKRVTAECNDFCDTFQPDDLIDKSLLLGTYASYASYITYLPANMQGSIDNGIMYILGKPGVKAPSLGILSCATIVLSVITSELADERRCQEKSQCLPCGSNHAMRLACRLYDTARTCAQSLGVKIPVDWMGLAARGTCMGGVFLQREIYRNTCYAACENSRAADAPVATASQGSITCCRCNRVSYADRWIGDEAFSSDYYWSRVSDYPGPVPECEGKNDTTTPSLLNSYDGYPVYFKYDSCSKVKIKGNACPSDHSYHPVLP